MSIFSPINLVGLLVAIFLDLFGVLCLLFNYIFGTLIGEALSAIGDLIGAFFFAIWCSVKSGDVASLKSVKNKSVKNKKRVIKFLLTFFGEAIPFIGALPFWTIFVLSEILGKTKK